MKQLLFAVMTFFFLTNCNNTGNQLQDKTGSTEIASVNKANSTV
ncbi:MAG TPA: hypothetical protein VFG10_08340 [Saprospiraceae bacterium]|nr:hypothetical protein [Saprospiraceae bacterium]